METITVDVAAVANALKVNDKVIAVAEKVVREGMKPQAKGQTRQTRRHWETFAQFAEAIGLPFEDALKALEGELPDTYTSPQQITQRRIEAERSMAEKYRKQAEKAQAFVANIVEPVIAEFGYLPTTPYKPTIKPFNTNNPETALLNCSDWHIGSAWPDEDTGMGDMSSNIISRRVEKLANKVIGLVNLQRHAISIPRLHINMLGDICENDALHASSGVQVDQPTVRQMMCAVNAAERMIRSFLVEFEEITVACVAGNHGRMGNKGDQHFQNNWDNLAYHLIAERFRNEDRVSIYISTLPFMAFTLPGFDDIVHCIRHGDGVPAPLGIPFYSLRRSESNVVTMLDRTIHYYHIAHFHQSASLEKFNGETIINGSLLGSSPYGISLGYAGQAKQRLIGMADEGKSWDYNIWLEPRRKFVADENHILTPYVQQMEDHQLETTG